MELSSNSSDSSSLITLTMRFSSFFALIFLFLPVIAAPNVFKPIEKTSGRKNDGSYIITLGNGVKKGSHLNALREKLGAEGNVTYSDWDLHIFNGFAAKLSQEALDFLLAHPDVARIEEDGVVNAAAIVNQVG